MKKIYIPFFFLFLFIVYAVQAQEDTTGTTDSTSESTEVDSVRIYINSIIKEVNRRSGTIDNIHAEGELTVKTKSIDNSGSIEIKAKKKDDVWFKIEGPLGIDIAEAHFNRKNFVFLNSRDDKVINGPTNTLNIDALTRISASFDDLLNTFTGTVRITKSKSDTLSIEESGGQYVISVEKTKNLRKYWIDKDEYLVTKYAYFNKTTGAMSMQIDFSNFTKAGEGQYARKIEIRRPKYNEYFKLDIEKIKLDVSSLDFYVSIPSGTKRINWK